jgi:hypothetical protein
MNKTCRDEKSIFPQKEYEKYLKLFGYPSETPPKDKRYQNIQSAQ